MEKKDLKEWFVPWMSTAREYNTSILDEAWQQPEYARLMLNENPLPPSQKVIDAVVDIMKYGNRYPDSMKRVRAKVGKLYDLGPENVRLCNGTSEIIDSMMRIFLQPGDEIIMSNPTFGLYPARAEITGAKVVSIPVRSEDLQYDVEAMLGAVNEKTKLILIINPNNPTGVYIDDKDLLRFCELGIPLCIDEAYFFYHPEVGSKAYLMKEYPHVFLQSTFSKAHGFCGIRFGYVLGTPEMIAAFNKMLLPWNVSLMSMAAAEAMLDNPEELAYKVEHNNKWMKIFEEEIKKLGLKPYPAPGNYMLVDASSSGKTNAEILAAAKKMEKVYLKRISPINGKDGFFRVTPGVDEENERFLKFIRAYFG
jgi:histidinol-phosphate aminotransferase